MYVSHDCCDPHDLARVMQDTRGAKWNKGNEPEGSVGALLDEAQRQQKQAARAQVQTEHRHVDRQGTHGNGHTYSAKDVQPILHS